MRVFRQEDCPLVRVAKASRPADARRLRQRLAMCHRTSISSRPIARRRRLTAGPLKVAVPVPTMGSSTPTRVRIAVPIEVQMRVAIRARWLARATRVARRRLAKVGATVDGRNSHRWLRAHRLSQADRVSQLAVRKIAVVRTVRLAVPLPRAVATVQAATVRAAMVRPVADMADRLVHLST